MEFAVTGVASPSQALPVKAQIPVGRLEKDVPRYTEALMGRPLDCMDPLACVWDPTTQWQMDLLERAAPDDILRF